MAASLIKNDPGWRETIKLWQEIRGMAGPGLSRSRTRFRVEQPTVASSARFPHGFPAAFASQSYSALFQLPKSPTSQEARGFFDPEQPGSILPFLEDYLPLYKDTCGQGFLVLPSGNHDTTPRLGNGRTPRSLKLAFLFLLTLPGVPFIYYGDEIGLRSPMGIKSKEGGYGRTGARTPMQWDATLNAGFSTAAFEQLYLPVEIGSERPNVAMQRKEDDFC